jgi:hypothetical protein
MDWARILACVTGMVDEELLTRNEYLAAENRILKAQLKGQLKLSDAERATLAEIGRRPRQGQMARHFSITWRRLPKANAGRGSTAEAPDGRSSDS